MKNVDFIQTLIKLNCSMCYILRLHNSLGDVLIMPKTETRQLKSTPKKFGPDTKLESKDEFLLALMKLRLGLLGKDVAHRFGISNILCTKIFHSWVRSMAEYFRSFVFIPDIETILATTPKRYRHFKNLIGIIDCSEIFIETPKKLELQSATWSE